MIRFHNKQWILDAEKHIVDSTWRTICYYGRMLSYQTNLHVYPLTGNSDVLLLGDAWQVDPSRPSVEDEIDTLAAKEFDLSLLYSKEETWCGRYVVLYKGTVVMDATGSMGCYIVESRVSSSFSLLWNIISKEALPYVHLPEGTNIDFCPGPKTLSDDITRLMPSQVYDIESGKYEFRPLLISEFKNMADSERLEKYIFYAQNSLKQMQSRTRLPIYCGITGGRDSRVGVALLESTGIEYIGYTLDLGEKSIADVAVAGKIAAITGNPYRLLHVNTEQRGISMEEWRIHCGGLEAGTERNFMRLIEAVNEPKVIFLRCGIFELICDYYSHEMEKPEWLYETFAYHGEFFKKACEEWEELLAQDVINTNVNKWTRMYWDLRLGSWLSACEQSIDIYDTVDHYQIFNCRLFIELLLGLDDKIRLNRDWENNVVRILYPKLVDVPYDTQFINGRLIVKSIIAKIVKQLKRSIPKNMYNSLKKSFSALVHKI